jgi:oligopeptide transport system substrate-binding protein
VRVPVVRAVVLILIAALMTAACSLPGADDAGPTGSPTLMPDNAEPQATATTVSVPPTPSVAISPTATTAPTPLPASPSGDGFARVIEAPPLPQRPAVTGDQTLIFPGSPYGPSTLDPALIADVEEAFYARQIFRGLVRLNDDLEPQPDLAQRIEISADGTRYVFKLKPNAVFHDGTAIDAEAVRASFNRASDPALADGDGYALSAAIYLSDIVGAVARLSGTVEEISGITVLGPTTLEIRLVAPVSDFLYKLSGSPAYVVDVRETDDDDWWYEPNGSGPFQLDTLSDDELVMLGFDGFYDGAPLLNEVVVLFGETAIEPMNLYDLGEIDLTEVPFYSVDRVLSPQDPLNAELISVPQLSLTFVLLNPTVEPFDDINVRRAVIQAFDASKVARVTYEGRVRQATGIIPPGILDREWPSEMLPYDLEAARAALGAAGEIDTAPAFYGLWVRTIMKQVIERDLSIEAESVSLDPDALYWRMDSKDLPALATGWIADYPDPSNFLTALFGNNSPNNYIDYTNPAVDDLLREAAVEPDEDRRAELYLQAQQLIIDDAVVIPLYHDVTHMLVKPYVHGLTVSAIGILSLETVWIGE